MFNEEGITFTMRVAVCKYEKVTGPANLKTFPPAEEDNKHVSQIHFWRNLLKVIFNI